MQDNVKINPEHIGPVIFQMGLYALYPPLGNVPPWPVKEVNYGDKSGPGRIVVAFRVMHDPLKLEPAAYLNSQSPYWRKAEGTVFTHAGESSYPFAAWHNSGELGVA